MSLININDECASILYRTDTNSQRTMKWCVRARIFRILLSLSFAPKNSKDPNPQPKRAKDRKIILMIIIIIIVIYLWLKVERETLHSLEIKTLSM